MTSEKPQSEKSTSNVGGDNIEIKDSSFEGNGNQTIVGKVNIGTIVYNIISFQGDRKLKVVSLMLYFSIFVLVCLVLVMIFGQGIRSSMEASSNKEILVEIKERDVRVILGGRQSALTKVPSFKIEKYEVSNERYKKCVEVDACEKPDTSSPEYNSSPNLPVTGVNVKQAADFCRWIGRKLPNQLQWESAKKQTSSLVNYQPDNKIFYNVLPFYLNPPQLRNVKENDSSNDHVFNLVGNVWEWTASYYKVNPLYEWDQQPNSINLEDIFVVKGKSYKSTLNQPYQNDPLEKSALPERGFGGHDSGLIEIGIRCVE
jgi:Sulfatase-modifying factor enzyme 1